MQVSSVVIKFGGVPMSSSSLVAASLRMVSEYSGCACVVVSAPGKSEGGRKVTDLLIEAWKNRGEKAAVCSLMDEIGRRFGEISSGLGLSFPGDELEEIGRRLIAGSCTYDWTVSRGEVLMARIVAELLGWPFQKAEELICLDQSRAILPVTYDRILKAAANGPFVLPGFIGSGPSGELRILSRGGSDITGALAARALGVDLYVNAKDVSGVATANPGLVPDAVYLPEISYPMMHELSVRGAEVLHPDAVAPVEDAGIPICIRGVLTPEHPGTRIVTSLSPGFEPVAVTGRKDFVYFEVHERGMNQRLGAGAGILGIFGRRGVSFDHVATGQHFMGVAVAEEQLAGIAGEIRQEIDGLLSSETIVYPMATVCVVTGRAQAPIMLGRALVALESRGIPPIMVSCTRNGSAIIGLDPERYEEAIKAVHEAAIR